MDPPSGLRTFGLLGLLSPAPHWNLELINKKRKYQVNHQHFVYFTVFYLCSYN